MHEETSLPPYRSRYVPEHSGSREKGERRVIKYIQWECGLSGTEREGGAGGGVIVILWVIIYTVYY